MTKRETLEAMIRELTTIIGSTSYSKAVCETALEARTWLWKLQFLLKESVAWERKEQ